MEAYRALVADPQHLGSRVTATDLEALRLLRTELRLIFTAATGGERPQVADRLNALLTRHPIHQEIVRHDGQRWHVHLVESGSTADRHAASAIAGLAGLVTGSGIDRLGICEAEGCGRAFIGTGTSAGGALLLRRMQAQGESAGFAGPRARQRPGTAVDAP